MSRWKCTFGPDETPSSQGPIAGRSDLRKELTHFGRMIVNRKIVFNTPRKSHLEWNVHPIRAHHNRSWNFRHAGFFHGVYDVYIPLFTLRIAPWERVVPAILCCIPVENAELGSGATWDCNQHWAPIVIAEKPHAWSGSKKVYPAKCRTRGQTTHGATFGGGSES